MILISLPAANQATLLCTFVIPALSLVPLLALVILVMKRKRLPPTTTDLEDQGPFKKGALFEGADEEPPMPVKVLHSQSPPRKKLRARKAIPRRMQHMKNNMTVWGDRWLPAVQPSTAGSQQGEIDPSGMYTASRSPPPSYRTTPLSPVVMPSSPSSPNPLPLSSDFKVVDDPAPPQPSSPAFDKMFLFGDSFGLGLADSFAEFETADQGPAYSPFPEGPCGFDFTAETPFSLSINTHPSYNASAGVPSFHSPSTFTPPHPDPFSNPLAPMEFRSGIPIANAPSNFSNSHVAYPVPGANSFSDWIPPPTAQPGLPLDNIALFPDGLTYDPKLPYSVPSQRTSTFPLAVWKASNVPYQGQVVHTMPMVAGYGTPPMYTGHGSPYLAVSDGQYSPVYHRSGSGSPMAIYSGQTPHYYPRAPLSPLPTRTASSGSVASMYSNNSSHAELSRTMSGCSDYSDFDYGYSSPHSAVFTGSPGSVGSSYVGLEGAYPAPTGSTSRTIPLPFHNPPPTHWLL